METLTINFSRRSSDIRTQFYPPIQLDSSKRHEIGLSRLETYNSIPNVDEYNNVIRYEYQNEMHDIIIPTGAYELSQVNEYVQSKLINPTAFELVANNNTLKCIIRINHPDIKIHFDHETSMKDMLGFRPIIIEGLGDHEGSTIVNILKVNSVFVNCDIITGSYVNTSQKPVLYSFFPNVPPGYKVIEVPNTPIYLPISYNYIDCIRLWLTDQDDNRIDLRGETLTVRLVIRSHLK